MASSTTHHPLAAKILQQVVAMILSPEHLIVLLSIQSSSMYKTEKDISEDTRMPANNVKRCLDELVECRIIKKTPFNVKSVDRRKQYYGYTISYRKALDNVIYTYCKILNDLSESRKVEQVIYLCSNPSCGQRLNYEQAVEYMDVQSFRFICPTCTMPMHQDQSGSRDVEGNRRLSAANSQLLELKKNLDLLRQEYQSVQDYPPYSKPTSVETTTTPHNKGVGRRQARDHSVARHSALPRRIESGPLPWELDSEEVECETPTTELVAESPQQLDIFSGVEYQRSEFMHSAKTFIHREASVVLESPEISPTAPLVFRFKKRKAGMRSSSATQF